MGTIFFSSRLTWFATAISVAVVAYALIPHLSSSSSLITTNNLSPCSHSCHPPTPPLLSPSTSSPLSSSSGTLQVPGQFFMKSEPFCQSIVGLWYLNQSCPKYISSFPSADTPNLNTSWCVPICNFSLTISFNAPPKFGVPSAL